MRQFHPKPGLCSVFCGKGHNAGDALVAARYLSGWGWELDLRFAYPAASLSALAAKKLKQLPGIPKGSSVVNSKRIILDGLLGIGARGEPRGEVADRFDRSIACDVMRALGFWQSTFPADLTETPVCPPQIVCRPISLPRLLA